MIPDTTFFTNEPGHTLLDRFKKTRQHIRSLDEIGIWSEIKLDIIKEYANAFTKGQKQT